MISLWVDDLRPAPAGWLWVKTSAQALAVLRSNDVAEISLDHDLGEDDTTRPVVRWMAEHDCWPATVRVHTANPVGRDYLEGVINHYGFGVTR